MLQTQNIKLSQFLLVINTDRNTSITTMNCLIFFEMLTSSGLSGTNSVFLWSFSTTHVTYIYGA